MKPRFNRHSSVLRLMQSTAIAVAVLTGGCAMRQDESLNTVHTAGLKLPKPSPRPPRPDPEWKKVPKPKCPWWVAVTIGCDKLPDPPPVEPEEKEAKPLK